MNPQDILNLLNNPLGFDALSPGMSPEQKVAHEQAQHEQFKLAQDFANTFGTESGKRVLTHLIEKTLDSSTWCASLGMEKGVPHGFAREGQNALVRYCQDMIKTAVTQKLQQKEEATNVNQSSA